MVIIPLTIWLLFYYFASDLMKQWEKLKEKTQEMMQQYLEFTNIRASMDGVKDDLLNISEAVDTLGKDSETGLEKCEVGQISLFFQAGTDLYHTRSGVLNPCMVQKRFDFFYETTSKL